MGYMLLPAKFLKKNDSANVKPKSGEKITLSQISRKLNCSSRVMLGIIRGLNKAGTITRNHKDIYSCIPLHANYLTKSSN